MTKHEELRSKIFSIFGQSNLEITWGEIVDGNLEEVIDKILQAVAEAMPRKRRWNSLGGTIVDGNSKGYNQALDEVQEILKGKE